MPGAAAGSPSIGVRLDFGSGLPSITEGVYERMQQQCPAKVLARPYSVDFTEEAGDESIAGIHTHKRAPYTRPCRRNAVTYASSFVLHSVGQEGHGDHSHRDAGGDFAYRRHASTQEGGPFAHRRRTVGS